jgi:hypothetical protein
MTLAKPLAGNEGFLFSVVAVTAARDSLEAFVSDHAFERMPPWTATCSTS